MDYKRLFSGHALNQQPSEIRALFAVANRPEVISLAGGMPNLKEMPFEEISKVMQREIATKGPKMWQYGEAKGDDKLRSQILNITKYEDVYANVDNVIVSTGSQQALEFVTQMLINPGDVVLAEAPNYVGALGVFVAHQADVVNIYLDDHGIIPAKLEGTILTHQKLGKTIKFLYTIPNFHNPAGVTMSVERRPEVLEICKKYGILVLEDNPYGLLDFEGETHPAIYSWDYDDTLGYAPNVIYLGSFSKIIAPGLRVGWIIAPPEIRDRLILSVESGILSPSTASQMTISAYLENFDWKKQIFKYRKMYKAQYLAMEKALEKYLPMCKFNKPRGGFYVWLELPEGLNSKELSKKAIDGGVAYVPGTGFFTSEDGEGKNFMRLSYCYPDPDEITEGIKRLAKVITSEIKKTDV